MVEIEELRTWFANETIFYNLSKSKCSEQKELMHILLFLLIILIELLLFLTKVLTH